VALLREREQKVDELHVRLGETMAAAAMWQGRAGMLVDRLALAESKIAQLEAPPSPPDAYTVTLSGETTPASSRLSWRSPWLYGVAGIAMLVLVIGLVALMTR